MFLLLGLILGAFYYGYMVFQIPGGWLALRVGGARLFGAAVLVASVLTLLTPAAARWSPVALIVLRILEGLALVSSSFDSTLKPVLPTEVNRGRNFLSWSSCEINFCFPSASQIDLQVSNKNGAKSRSGRTKIRKCMELSTSLWLLLLVRTEVEWGEESI